jgi:hypothetical protein
LNLIRTFSKNKRGLLFCLLLLPVTIPALSSPAHAITSSLNTIDNPSFEEGLVSPAPGLLPSLPADWGNWTKHGTPDSTIGVDTNRAHDGRNSTRLDVGQMEIGFIAMYQTLPETLRFGNLSDRPDGLDFWFYLEPKYDGLGDFRVRILYGENVAELNYVFDPSPALSYPNITDSEGRPLAISIFLYGYDAGVWHHFQRNLRADWQASGFPLEQPFPRIQFDALTFHDIEAGHYLAERVWIDNVKLYRDVGTPEHWLRFNFQDQAQNDVGPYVEWKLFNSSGKSISYQMDEVTLPEEVFILEVYYPSYTGQLTEPFRIHRQTIVELDRIYTINLSMTPNPSDPGGYVAFDGPAQASGIQQNTSTIAFTASGTANAIIIRVPSKPTTVLKDGIEISEPIWSHYPAYGVVIISTSTLGKFSLLFTVPLRMPTIVSTDRSGNPVDNIVELRIFDPSGGILDYSPGGVVPGGTYRLEFYYEGHRIFTGTLEPSTNPGLTLPIQLQMLPIGPAQGGYLALNITQTSITILEQNSQRLTFRIEGDGPVLVVAKVSKKPLYIERDGQRVFWSYSGTTMIASVESETSGTFSLVMEENSTLLSFPIIYLAGAGIIAAIIVGTAAMLLLRGKRPRATQGGPASKSLRKALQARAFKVFAIYSRSA